MVTAYKNNRIDDALGQPALQFERENRMHGIAGRYEFPATPGMNRLSIQRKIWPTSRGNKYVGWGSPSVQLLPRAELESIFSALEKLNPHVSKIRFNRHVTEELRDVVHGMVSGFNPDDINLFIRRIHGGLSLDAWERTSEAIRNSEFSTKIFQRLENPRIRWIPAEPTLEKIWQQVKDRPILHAFEKAKAGVRNSMAEVLMLGGVAAAAGYAWYEYVRSKQPLAKTKDDSPGHVTGYLNEKQHDARSERAL